MAQVRLPVQELSSVDPRPIKEVLSSAVHLADVTMQDYAQGVIHGDASPAMVDRMLESARYTASLAKIALDSGLPLDHEPGAGLVPLDSAISAIAPATLSVIEDVITATVELRSSADARYRDELVAWVPRAMAARVRGEAGPPVPERPPLAEVVYEPAADQPPEFRTDVIDAVIVAEDSAADSAYSAVGIDEDDDVPSGVPRSPARSPDPWADPGVPWAGRRTGSVLPGGEVQVAAPR